MAKYMQLSSNSIPLSLFAMYQNTFGTVFLFKVLDGITLACNKGDKTCQNGLTYSFKNTLRAGK